MARTLTAERHALILKEIEKNGFATVPQMAKQFNVSEMTIRRDFDALAANNLLKRTHGGAVSMDNLESNIDLVEPRHDVRATQHVDEKAKIAKAAVQHILANSFIALDVGTTNFQIALRLREFPVRVLTSSIKIADALSESRPQVYLPGGELRGKEPSIVGPQAINSLNELYVDIYFLGASSVSAEGLYDYSPEDVAMKKAIIQKARKVIAVVDHSKMDRTSVARICDLSKIDRIITDVPPAEHLQEIFEQHNVIVEIVK